RRGGRRPHGVGASRPRPPGLGGRRRGHGPRVLHAVARGAGRRGPRGGGRGHGGARADRRARRGPWDRHRRGAYCPGPPVGGEAAVLMGSVPVVLAIPAWAVAGAGMGLAYSMPSLVVLADADPAAVGAATAALVLTDVLGVALGTGIGGALIALAAHSGWA